MKMLCVCVRKPRLHCAVKSLNYRWISQIPLRNQTASCNSAFIEVRIGDKYKGSVLRQMVTHWVCGWKSPDSSKDSDILAAPQQRG
jgi:hypothetical protein